MTPWKKAIGKALARTGWLMFGYAAWGSIIYLGYYAWKFVYNTDNQFGHIIVSMIVALAWIAYAVVAAIIGFIAVTSD